MTVDIPAMDREELIVRGALLLEKKRKAEREANGTNGENGTPPDPNGTPLDPDPSWVAHVDGGDADVGDVDGEPSGVRDPAEPPPRGPQPSPPPPPPPWAERVLRCRAGWFEKAPPARVWLLGDNRTNDGALPLGKVGMLIGEGGVSKTMALTSLALAVATGEPWLGTYSVATPGRVLLLLGEEDAMEVQRRVYNARRAGKAPIPEDDSIVVLPLEGLPCPLIELDARGNPIDAPFLHWLRTFIRENGPFALVVVDPLSRFAHAEAEVDSGAATRFVQSLESIAREAGATVLVSHHTNKISRNGSAVSGSSSRGASAIPDGVRWQAALSATEKAADSEEFSELVTFRIVKSNYGRKGDPVLLRRDTENGGALVPLSKADRERLAQAQQAADPRAKRKAEREADREERRARDNAEREKRAELKAAERKAAEEARSARETAAAETRDRKAARAAEERAERAADAAAERDRKAAERRKSEEEREAQAAAERAQREAVRVAADRAREAFEDTALEEVLSKRPEITQRDLRAAMATACSAFGGCGHTRVDMAQERRRMRKEAAGGSVPSVPE